MDIYTEYNSIAALNISFFRLEPTELLLLPKSYVVSSSKTTSSYLFYNGGSIPKCVK